VAQIDPTADALVSDWLSLPEVADRLGLPSSRVKQLLRDRKLLAVARPSGERAVPAAFIDGDQVVKGLHGTLTVLYDCGFDESEALRWLFTADETLPGTPIQALYKHRGTEVNRRAQALAFLPAAWLIRGRWPARQRAAPRGIRLPASACSVKAGPPGVLPAVASCSCEVCGSAARRQR
jgi:hypothetical protein